MRIQVIGDQLEVEGVPVLSVLPGAPFALLEALRETLGSIEFERELRRNIALGRAVRR